MSFVAAKHYLRDVKKTKRRKSSVSGEFMNEKKTTVDTASKILSQSNNEILPRC